MANHTAAVIGVGATKFGSHAGKTEDALGLEALVRAAEDCGLSLADIDGLIVNRIGDYQEFCRLAGMNPKYVTGTPFGGRNTGPTLIQAAKLIEVGAADTIAVVHGNTGRSQGAKYGGNYGGAAEALTFGMVSPGAFMAAAMRRHMSLYGTTTDHLAEVATAFRYHASLNPEAVMREPYSIEEYREARLIVDPLRLYDYCLINDGGVALILTRADRARDLRQKPVYITGTGQASALSESAYPATDFWFEPSQAAGRDAFGQAKCTAEDVDALMIYDSFSPSVLFALEGFGFCPVGESGAFVSGGRLRLDGELPTNLSGGHLSESYMQGYALNVEAVRQIRGECGERQVPGTQCSAFICAGVVSSAIIYSSEQP